MFDSAWLSQVPPPPEGSDVSGAVAALLRRGLDQLETQGEPELYPGYAWTILAGQETEQLVAIEGRYPFLERITFGFFEPEVEDRTVSASWSMSTHPANCWSGASCTTPILPPKTSRWLVDASRSRSGSLLKSWRPA